MINIILSSILALLGCQPSYMITTGTMVKTLPRETPINIYIIRDNECHFYEITGNLIYYSDCSAFPGYDPFLHTIKEEMMNRTKSEMNANYDTFISKVTICKFDSSNIISVQNYQVTSISVIKKISGFLGQTPNKRKATEDEVSILIHVLDSFYDYNEDKYILENSFLDVMYFRIVANRLIGHTLPDVFLNRNFLRLTVLPEFVFPATDSPGSRINYQLFYLQDQMVWRQPIDYLCNTISSKFSKQEEIRDARSALKFMYVYGDGYKKRYIKIRVSGNFIATPISNPSPSNNSLNEAQSSLLKFFTLVDSLKSN
jgi:hypothetical protein